MKYHTITLDEKALTDKHWDEMALWRTRPEPGKQYGYLQRNYSKPNEKHSAVAHAAPQSTPPYTLAKHGETVREVNPLQNNKY